MNIVCFETPRHEEEILKNLVSPEKIIFTEENLTSDNLDIAKNAEIISVFINSRITKETLDALPNLKYICTRSTGFDHIDIKEASIRGIKVSNVPAYGSQTVAEFTFALLLSLSRKIFDATHQIKEAGDFSISTLRGFDLSKKTLGIIGTGRIGKNVAKIALGFDMEVIAYDLNPDKEHAEEAGFSYVGLSELIKKSDVITLHVPYDRVTHHLINKKLIENMKPGVYIINTARGELIDTDALIWGLNEKIIAGAGLDVLEGEREIKEEIEIMSSHGKTLAINDYKTLLQDHILMSMPEVIVTPHIAFFTKEAEESILKTTAKNIGGYLKGNPSNLVN